MSDFVDKLIQTPRGDGRTMTELDPVSARQAATPPGVGADWFGPRTPMPPIAPPEVAGRTWDFPTGYNLQMQPRAFEDIDFATLRLLANAYDPIRLIIERRKDQLCRLPWAIRVKHESGTRRPKTAELPASTRGRIKEITNFFKTPDFGFTFRTWLRQLLEDLLVIDAPAIYCERNGGGDLISLRVTDGSLVKRVVSDWGCTPRPLPWTGRPFMWNGEQVTAENYQRRGFRLIGDVMFPPAYQLVLKGLPALSYSTRDLIYKPHNIRPGHAYGLSAVESILNTINIAMRRARSQLEYYREGNIPEGVLGVPESWTPDMTQKFEDYWNNLFVGNLGRRRQMKFIPGGSKSSYVPFKEPALKTEMDEWLVRIVCFAFSYPPSAFVALSNRSIAEQHERQSEEEGVEPLKNWVSELINGVIEDEFGEEDLEFAWVEEAEVDQSKQAEILCSYVDRGILTVDEARERLGEAPLGNATRAP